MFEGLFQPMHLPGKLPELGAGFGKGICELRRALHDGAKDADDKTQTPKESGK